MQKEHMPCWPSSGEYDFFDVWEDFKCEYCSKNLTANFRIWLKDWKVECLEVTKRSPDPDPWCSAYELSFSPDGNFLAIQSKSDKIWMLSCENNKWQIHFKKCLWPQAWYPNSESYIHKGGEIVQVKTGKTLDTIKLPVYDFRAAHINPQGWIMLEWANILKKQSGLYIYFPENKQWENHELSYHSGVVMSGKVFFEPQGNRLLRVHPNRHGGHLYQLELYQIDPEKKKPIQLLAKYEEEWLEVLHVFWDAEGSILAGYAHYGQEGRKEECMPFGIIRLDGKTLSEINREHQLDEESCRVTRGDDEFEMEQYVDFDGLFQLDQPDKKILMVTDMIHILNEQTGRFDYQGKLEENLFVPVNRNFYEHYTVACHTPGNLLAVSFRKELYIYDLRKKQIIALGSHITRVCEEKGIEYE